MLRVTQMSERASEGKWIKEIWKTHNWAVILSSKAAMEIINYGSDRQSIECQMWPLLCVGKAAFFPIKNSYFSSSGVEVPIMLTRRLEWKHICDDTLFLTSLSHCFSTISWTNISCLSADDLTDVIQKRERLAREKKSVLSESWAGLERKMRRFLT